MREHLGAAIRRRPGAAAMRLAGFFAIWVVLAGRGGGEMLPGLFASVAATWASLWLLPAGGGSLQPRALASFILRFLGQSVLAGADVARRALDPALPLEPGLVRYATGLPPGTARNAFTTIMSLLPGTAPVGTAENGALSIHCLDTTQPVATQLAAEEALFNRVIGRFFGDE